MSTEVRKERTSSESVRQGPPSFAIPTADERAVLDVQEAGLALGMGRTAAYDAVRRGQIPSLRLGRRIVVPTALLRQMLGLDG